MLLAWMAFLGGSMATRMEKHIQVDALSRVIPKALRPWARAIGLLITTLFCGYMAILAYEHVFGAQGDFGSGEIRPATRIPAWTILLAAVVSFMLMTLRFLGKTIDAFLHPQVPEQKVSH
ncbi:MAG: TRAP transporter small permease [bacterium]